MQDADYDVFISHASEDKESFVRPLAERLREKGLRVWYDEFTLRLGDSLTQSINAGLAQSRFGIVVVSPHFMRKSWPQVEINVLLSREVTIRRKVILPIWHEVTFEQVRAYSLMLADKLAVLSAAGLDTVVDRVLGAVNPYLPVDLQEPPTPSIEAFLAGGTPTLSAVEAEKAISKRAAHAIIAIRDGNWLAIAGIAHPSKGIRLSPYAYVHTEPDGDRVLRNDELRHAMADTSIRRWGAYDGSGHPIDLTFRDFVRRFVYDVAFINAPAVAYNTILRQGNTRNNWVEAYPGAAMQEYHYPGVDPQFAGIDWRSLRLVFEQLQSEWYLVGLIHDQWTI